MALLHVCRQHRTHHSDQQRCGQSADSSMPASCLEGRSDAGLICLCLACVNFGEEQQQVNKGHFYRMQWIRLCPIGFRELDQILCTPHAKKTTIITVLHYQAILLVSLKSINQSTLLRNRDMDPGSCDENTAVGFPETVFLHPKPEPRGTKLLSLLLPGQSCKIIET